MARDSEKVEGKGQGQEIQGKQEKKELKMRINTAHLSRSPPKAEKYIEEEIQQDQFQKGFKRSDRPSTTVVPKNRSLNELVEHPLVSDSVPLQPLAPSRSKSMPKRKIERQETEVSMASFVRMFAAGASTQKIGRGQRPKKRRRSGQLQQLDHLKVQDQRRMKSLERIYLQKQSNFK